ncbi:MAG: alpha/beta hydrolase [Kordiimonadaceae bacterium]|nr:alpha/beta hydrolase [Kordiimonadaceae bacterium]
MTKYLYSIMVFVLLMISEVNAQEQPSETVIYKTIGDVTLSLHIFNPEGHSREHSTPAIVFFHGGGWNGGSPSQFYPQSAYLASRGMVAINVEYRLKDDHGTSPAESVKDAKSAMRWVRRHAVELGINPNMIAAGGGSAGGHLAAASATLKDFNEISDDLSISARPEALVLFNPVYDNGPGGYGHERVAEYWQDFSPLHNLTENTPPTITFFGTADELVPVATAQAFKSAMSKLGVRSDLHLYEDQPHGFFNQAKYTETVREMDKFLSSLGFISGAPTL